MGLLDQANAAFTQLNVSLAENFEEISVAVADVGLGLVPVVGVAKDAYELISGSHLITGEKLSRNERILIGASILTLGVGSSVKGLAKGVLKVSQKFGSGIKRGVLRSSEMIIDSARKLGLEAKEEAQGIRRFLKNTLGNEDGAIKKVDNLLFKAGGNNLKAYSHATKELSESGVKLSKNADEFLSKQVLHGDRILGKGTSFVKDDLVRVGKKYDDLATKIYDVAPTRVEADVWRAVPVTVKDGTGNIIARNTEDTVFNFHKGTQVGNGRYSAPGDSALYTSLGKKEDAWQTVMEELSGHANQDLILNSKHYKLDKVLDLTDRSTKKALGITEDMIIDTQGDKTYELTHLLGNIAKKKGFNGIKAPSAPQKGGVNLIIFGE